MKTRVKHYRVPKVDRTKQVRKGAPFYLRRYGRAAGWFEQDDAVGEWDGIEPLSRGGKTVCEIIDDSDKENKLMSVGVAVCSMSDNFNYRLGRNIAVGRAKAGLDSMVLLMEEYE